MGYFPLEFSDHARQKMALRSISKEDVFQIVRSPEVVARSNGEHKLMRGDLTAVLGPARGGRWCVITVLLRESEQWDDEAARSRTR